MSHAPTTVFRQLSGACATLSVAIFFASILAQHAGAQTTQPQLRTRAIRVEIPTEPWPGWQSGLINEPPAPTTNPAPSELMIFPTPAGERPTFSGKVVGLSSYDNVEVAVISVFSREYFSHNAYLTTLVREDGSFSIKSQEQLDRPKTVCVRAPGFAWTYVQQDIPPGQSARDIVLKPEPGRRISVTAVQQDDPRKIWMNVDAFDGYQRRSADGKPLHSAYYGGRQSEDGTTAIMLPLRPTALRVRGEGLAMGCVIVDPREVDQITVELPREARIKARVLADGKSLAARGIWFFNPNVRLSGGAVETDSEGIFELSGLVPGEYHFVIDGQAFSGVLKQGRTTDMIFTLGRAAP